MSNKTVVIGTHDGTFHCDEALAIFMLKLLPRYKDAKIIRTRNDDILDTCDIVVDVGKRYDPACHRYDHHMRHFKETWNTLMKEGFDSSIKLSSAGLIYCHFGKEIIKHLLPEDTSEAVLKATFRRVYYKLIQEIDGIDNGVPMFNGEPLYNISSGISERVDRLNPPWNDKTTDFSEQFYKAIDLVGEEFLFHVHYSVDVWWPARCIVDNALDKRFKIDESGEIIELETTTPWKGHLAELEVQRDVKPCIKFVIFYDDRDNTYRVRAVPLNPQSFVCRVFLPESWGGLKDKELEVASGITGCIFVHSTRFIGSHKTRQGAIEMARKALQLARSAPLNMFQ